MSHDARRAYAMQLPTLLAYPSAQSNNTPRPFPAYVARWGYEISPRESMEPPDRLTLGSRGRVMSIDPP